MNQATDQSIDGPHHDLFPASMAPSQWMCLVYQPVPAACHGITTEQAEKMFQNNPWDTASRVHFLGKNGDIKGLEVFIERKDILSGLLRAAGDMKGFLVTCVAHMLAPAYDSDPRSQFARRWIETLMSIMDNDPHQDGPGEGVDTGGQKAANPLGLSLTDDQAWRLRRLVYDKLDALLRNVFQSAFDLQVIQGLVRLAENPFERCYPVQVRDEPAPMNALLTSVRTTDETGAIYRFASATRVLALTLRDRFPRELPEVWPCP